MTNPKGKNKNNIDPVTGVETTHHEWDGIEELNNPAPRWWLWVFFLTFLWSIWYWVVYPAWPTPEDHTKGQYEWTQYKQLNEKQKEIVAVKEAYAKEFSTYEINEVQNHVKVYNFALAGGEIAFKNNCATCHGSGAAGNDIYPNLNDDDWLWGGSLDDIYTTIKYGIRSGHDETRFSQMPAFKKDGILSAEEVEAVASHVLSLSGRGIDDVQGAEIFAEQCVACHGEAGQGNRDIGAPNLADAIWLYGAGHHEIIKTISYARNGLMPHWVDRLDDDTIKQLAIYVHSLGGGE